MSNDLIVYLNGKFVPWDQATVHMMSHSFTRGSTIFEVLSFHERKKCSVIFRIDEHIKRLYKTAELLDMELPLSKNELRDAISSSVKRNNVKQGFIKIMGFYPQIAFEILPPQKKLDISIFVVEADKENSDIELSQEYGSTVSLSKWRKLDPQTVPVEAKVAANYLNGMMARIEARDRGFNYALLLDTQGFIAEGGTESFFLVKEGCLLTPSMGTILDSITRKSLLQAARDIGIESYEGRLSPELLETADEIFLSGTPHKLLPVKKIENRILKDVPGPVTRVLSKKMKEILDGRDDCFESWFFSVK